VSCEIRVRFRFQFVGRVCLFGLLAKAKSDGNGERQGNQRRLGNTASAHILGHGARCAAQSSGCFLALSAAARCVAAGAHLGCVGCARALEFSVVAASAAREACVDEVGVCGRGHGALAVGLCPHNLAESAAVDSGGGARLDAGHNQEALACGGCGGGCAHGAVHVRARVLNNVAARASVAFVVCALEAHVT